jgi:hypothetical protein
MLIVKDIGGVAPGGNRYRSKLNDTDLGAYWPRAQAGGASLRRIAAELDCRNTRPLARSFPNVYRQRAAILVRAPALAHFCRAASAVCPARDLALALSCASITKIHARTDPGYEHEDEAALERFMRAQLR